MAKKVTLEQAQYATGQEKEYLYNALDTISTYEIHETLWARASDAHRRAHDFYMALQGPAMEMTMTGIAVDDVERGITVRKLRLELEALARQLGKHPKIAPIWDNMEKVTGACPKSPRKDGKHTWAKGEPDTPERKCTSCGKSRMKIKPFNPKSNADLKHLFYDLLQMTPQKNKDGNVTADREARMKLEKKYPKHNELLTAIGDYADRKKQLEFLSFRTSADGRFMSSFNVGVAITGRWSSNKNSFGEGANAQNVTERHRNIFVADPGKEIVYMDLKQAESNLIAHEAGDEGYIAAHTGGDTHTFVTRLVWPEGVDGIKWTGDIKQDKKIAKSHNPVWDKKPGHDFRFQSKAVQHGSNLGLSPFGLSLQKHIPLFAAQESQKRYFKAFPGIRAYQNNIRQLVRDQAQIVNSLGIPFRLFGRPWDEHTFKQGLAIKPQSTVGHIIGIGAWRIQHELPEVQLLAQIHDAILIQIPKGRYELIEKALDCMMVPVSIKGVDGKVRCMKIGTEAAVGINWGHASDENPAGLHEIEFNPDHSWRIE